MAIPHYRSFHLRDKFLHQHPSKENPENTREKDINSGYIFLTFLLKTSPTFGTSMKTSLMALGFTCVTAQRISSVLTIMESLAQRPSPELVLLMA